METSTGIEASLSGRYATALFDLAREGGAIDRVGDDLSGLRQAMAESAELRALIESPMIGREAAGRAIASVAETMGLDGTTRRFLGVLAHNGRLNQLGAIARTYATLVARHYNRVSAEVVSAHPLADDQVDALRAKLAQRFGRDISVDLQVDPAILGGLVVRVGSQQIDSSIRTKLNNLAHAMKA